MSTPVTRPMSASLGKRSDSTGRATSSVTRPPPVGDDHAARPRRQRATDQIFDRDVWVDERARDLEPQRLELGGEPRRQRIVVGHRQQYDARMRRLDGAAGLGARRRRAQHGRDQEQEKATDLQPRVAARIDH